PKRVKIEVILMSKEFQVGEHVAWNSEADVSGTIIKVYTEDVDYKGNVHHADARMSSNTKSRAPRPTTYDAQRLHWKESGREHHSVRSNVDGHQHHRGQ